MQTYKELKTKQLLEWVYFFKITAQNKRKPKFWFWKPESLRTKISLMPCLTLNALYECKQKIKVIEDFNICSELHSRQIETNLTNLYNFILYKPFHLPSISIPLCLSVMYSDEYDICSVAFNGYRLAEIFEPTWLRCSGIGSIPTVDRRLSARCGNTLRETPQISCIFNYVDTFTVKSPFSDLITNLVFKKVFHQQSVYLIIL